MSARSPSPASARQRLLSGEFIVPAALAIITLVYLVSAIQLGPPMKGGNMTASFFPIVTAVIMLIALVCAMLHALRSNIETDAQSSKSDPENDEQTPAGARYAGLSLGAIGVVLLTAGYLIAFDLIGYFVATFCYVLLLCCLFGGGFKRQWLTKSIAAIVITLAGYLLFEVVFQVRLPTLWSQ